MFWTKGVVTHGTKHHMPRRRVCRKRFTLFAYSNWTTRALHNVLTSMNLDVWPLVIQYLLVRAEVKGHNGLAPALVFPPTDPAIKVPQNVCLLKRHESISRDEDTAIQVQGQGVSKRVGLQENSVETVICQSLFIWRSRKVDACPQSWNNRFIF